MSIDNDRGFLLFEHAGEDAFGVALTVALDVAGLDSNAVARQNLRQRLQIRRRLIAARHLALARSELVLLLCDRMIAMVAGDVRRCEDCGRPATCIGRYEMRSVQLACDECCGHGCEDGLCVPIDSPGADRWYRWLADEEET